jgi:DNA-binding PadR family transcriptional regulator
VNRLVNDLHDKIIKEMLNIINTHEIYGFEILSLFKEKHNNLDDTLIYSSLKSLEKNGFITTFKTCEDGNCCVKVRYCLSKKGHEMLNSLT